jgi:hypothetical protein
MIRKKTKQKDGYENKAISLIHQALNDYLLLFLLFLINIQTIYNI